MRSDTARLLSWSAAPLAAECPGSRHPQYQIHIRRTTSEIMPNCRRTYPWLQIEAAESSSVYKVASPTRTRGHALQQRRPRGRKTGVQRIQTGADVVRIPAVCGKKRIHGDLPLQRYAPAESRSMPNVAPTCWPPFRSQIVRIGRQRCVVVLRIGESVVAE